VDNLPTSPGHVGHLGDRNSPTTFNSSLHIKQFWDGRANDLVEQATGPMTNPGEMAMASEESVLERLKENPEYAKLFKAAFPSEENALSVKNAAIAIAEFEKTLLTPSRFDKYLEGDESALTEKEKLGLKMFVENGCVACHSGIGLGGHMFQKLGLVKPYQTEDHGKYKVTKNEADKYVFKVPSLRNIEKTGPYFHDGKVKTLADAVKLMASHQLGKDLSEGDIENIVVFLRSLTGELPK
jgi:cytochrome c peroxidase